MDQVSFTIMHIDNSRYDKMAQIKNALFFYDEVTDIEFVRGADSEQVKRMFQKYPNFGFSPLWHPKLGEVGVWFSQMQCWDWAAKNDRHLIVFEDDAMIDPNFEKIWLKLLEELPADYDFFSIFVPNNQEGDYFWRGTFDHNGVPNGGNYAPDEASSFNFGANYVAKVYQGYSCVATMYSPKGARKLLALADEYKLYTPVDCFLFLQAHQGNLEGYAPKPSQFVQRIVSIDWNAPTTIHHTDRIDYSTLED